MDPENNLESNFKDFIHLFNSKIKLKNNQSIHFELGRSIVGQCGFLISKILYTKKSYNKNFIVLDSGMNNLIRPALYNSKHKISNISSRSNKIEAYDKNLEKLKPLKKITNVRLNQNISKISKNNNIIILCLDKTESVKEVVTLYS